jgi:preprotein translocase subunit YajC
MLANFWMLAAGASPPPPVPSGAPGGAVPRPDCAQGGAQNMIFMVLLMVFVFWLLLIRPQRKREEEQRKFLDALKPKDEVVTHSGIIGEIVSIKENEVVLRVDARKDVQLTVARSVIASRWSKKGEVPAASSAPVPPAAGEAPKP